jgi:hypothetical protein
VNAFNRGGLNGLKALLAEDAEIQGVLGKGHIEKVGPIWRQLIEGYGMNPRIERLIAEGNVVAARYVESGTFRAPATPPRRRGNSGSHRHDAPASRKRRP